MGSGAVSEISPAAARHGSLFHGRSTTVIVAIISPYYSPRRQKVNKTLLRRERERKGRWRHHRPNWSAGAVFAGPPSPSCSSAPRGRKGSLQKATGADGPCFNLLTGTYRNNAERLVDG